MSGRASRSASRGGAPKSVAQLRVFIDRCELQAEDGSITVFEEGAQSPGARTRYQAITQALSEGYLAALLAELAADPMLPDLEAPHIALIEGLVDGVTSEAGRALVALTITLMCVKAIQPAQSVRLHKGGRGTTNFSWREGISLRTIDQSFITPELRTRGLLSLNRYGFMMTRSLAENYPYSPFYKPRLRGPRDEWLGLVEALEDGSLAARDGLKLLLSKLLARTAAFRTAAEGLVRAIEPWAQGKGLAEARRLIMQHITESPASARLFEISMHALWQALEDRQLLPGALRPLAQMRSANKKAGNLGDIELVEDAAIVEAWDAKFGRSILFEELGELSEKLVGHDSVRRVGFVVDGQPELRDDVVERRDVLQTDADAEILLLSWEEWIDLQVRLFEGDTSLLAQEWLIAYAESLCLMRPDRAPIDEPTGRWIQELRILLS